MVRLGTAALQGREDIGHSRGNPRDAGPTGNSLRLTWPQQNGTFGSSALFFTANPVPNPMGLRKSTLTTHPLRGRPLTYSRAIHRNGCSVWQPRRGPRCRMKRTKGAVTLHHLARAIPAQPEAPAMHSDTGAACKGSEYGVPGPADKDLWLRSRSFVRFQLPGCQKWRRNRSASSGPRHHPLE